MLFLRIGRALVHGFQRFIFVNVLLGVVLFVVFQPFKQQQPAIDTMRAPSAAQLEADFCARSGEVWDEVNHTCVPSYVLKDRVANQHTPTEPGCDLGLMGTSEKAKTRRDISILGGLKAQGSALVLTPISDAPMLLVYDSERGMYGAMYFNHPDTAVETPADPGNPIRFERHCGSGILYMEFVYDGSTWWQLIPNPLEDVEITVDNSTLPQKVRDCYSINSILVDEIVVRTQTPVQGETFVARVPALPNGYHELTYAYVLHAWKTSEGGTAYDIVAWASQNTYLMAGKSNVVRIDSWLLDDELQSICSK